ncbi:MAG: M14 family metallopeptidase [Halofilum sp. (in: g-proteobacteria)]|nr:M14 family metallopeptidase [Halofilum sp. (in: g-proteobacteria)]
MTEPSLLHRRDTLPDGFLEAAPEDLHRLFSGPTLIHLDGAAERPLFIALLQHGNETSGLTAVQRLLSAPGDTPLPRPVTLFVANIEAARAGVRRLDHQPDYNRCWPGTEEPPCPETRMMAAIIEEMTPRRPLAAIDLHNTTGTNPIHAGLNVLDDQNLQLAARFARTAVHFTRPRGAMPAAFAGVCPSLILECGTPGDLVGLAAADDFLQQCLRLEAVPEQPPASGELELFESTAIVFVPDGIRVAFGDDRQAELVLRDDIDEWNFRELAAGTVFGRTRGPHWPVRALAPDGREVTAELFEIETDRLRLRRAMMPGLLTGDARIIRQDCLCYLMERVARIPGSSDPHSTTPL